MTALKKIRSKPFWFFLLLIVSLPGYIALGYFTPRTHFLQLLSLFAFLFIAYGLIYKFANAASEFRIAIFASVVFRIALLFVIPNLSDDYFRFIWDGKLSSCGINPYTVLPSKFIHTGEVAGSGLNNEIFNGLNSKNYYTIYPPVMQLIFYLAAKLFPENPMGSIIVMRLFIILAEMWTMLVGMKILKSLNLPQKNILLYSLNPLVIIELTGNLHFEAVMIFFLLIAIWFLYKQKYLVSSLFFAFSVATKLIPLLLIPLLFKRIGVYKTVIYFLGVGIIVLLFFLPFLDGNLIYNFSNSLNLYFQKFEFNASIYYLIRWVGLHTTGYNIIQWAGPVLSSIASVIILLIAFWKRSSDWNSFFSSAIFMLLIYYLFATIVHPWYSTVLVAMSFFTPFRFPIVWSALIPLSYFAYTSTDYRENLWLVGVEYLCLIMFVLFELKQKKKIPEVL